MKCFCLIALNILLLFAIAQGQTTLIPSSQYLKLQKDSTLYVALTKSKALLQYRLDSLIKADADSAAYVASCKPKTDSLKTVDTLLRDLTALLHREQSLATADQKKIEKYRTRDSAIDVKTIAAARDTLRRLNDELTTLNAAGLALGKISDSLHDRRYDSVTGKARIREILNEHHRLSELSTKDSLDLAARRIRLNANPDIALHQAWQQFFLTDSIYTALQIARDVLDNPYRPNENARALDLLTRQWTNPQLSATERDSAGRYRQLLANYCKISAGCYAAIADTRSDFNADLQDQAAKALAEKAGEVKVVNYPFLHKELLRLSGLAKTYKGGGKEFILQSPIKDEPCP